jgi:protein-tyrosine-phosphatase/predicted ATP-grasp superfamily ATP-dependent carboligase
MRRCSQSIGTLMAISSPGKVLVLGHDTRSFLTVIRSLGRFGCEVHVGNCPSSSPSLSSKYVNKVQLLPTYDRASVEQWKSAIRSLFEREHYDLVIPCHDEDLIPLQVHRATFESAARIYLLSERAFEITSNKFKANSLMQSLGVMVPRFAALNEFTEINRLHSEFAFPLVAKPFGSFTIDSLSSRKTVKILRDSSDAAALLKDKSNANAMFIQEYFEGSGVGVEVLADKGNILFAFQHARVYEWPKGVSSYRKSVPLDSSLLEATRTLISALDYTGVAMVEYKVNQSTGEWRFIEVNGRFWGSLPLAVASGADFPRFLFELLVVGKHDFPGEYRRGVFCRNLIMDLERLRSVKNARRHNSPSDSLLKTAMLASRNFLTFRERSDTFVLDDLAPGFRELSSWVWTKCKGIAFKAGITFLGLPPIKSVLIGSFLKKRIQQSRSILFVCKGNICRSPFAEFYAVAILGSSKEVVSAGYLPPFGRPSPELAVDASRDYGVDLLRHQSRPIDKIMLDKADVIFVFDHENRQAVVTLMPSIKEKVYYLGLLKSGGSVIINDPYSGDLEDFKTTYSLISSCILKIRSMVEDR